MNGAEYLCRLLERKGVAHIFGLFGDIQTQFAHAASKSSIKWIGVHNEKCGGFMADIYARVSSNPGVVFTTLGPGATNLATALANATQDRSPLIAISDQSPLSECQLETHQYLNFEEAFNQNTGITKWSVLVRDIKDLASILDKAFQTAQTEPMGAVHISIPADLFSHDVPSSFLNKGKVAPKKAGNYPKSTLTFKQLVKDLHGKKPGLVIVGGTVERSGSKEKFLKFIEHYKLPVLTTFRGKNSIPSNHPQCLGTISRHLGKAIHQVLTEADYLLTIGYDYNEGVKPALWKDKIKKVINIDCFDNRIKGVFEPASFFGDLSEIFNRLNKEKAPKYEQLFNFDLTKQMVKDTVAQALQVKNDNLHPKRIIEAVNQVFNHDSIIVCDIGLNKYYSGLLLESSDSNKILFSNGLSSMAFSSGALGAKISNPNKHVVVMVGDGGFLMDLQEVITATQHRYPIIWLVFNNGGLGLVEQAQVNNGSQHYGVKFGKVNFTHLAEAFGIKGFRLGSRDSLITILQGVKKLKSSAIIDVPVDYANRIE